MENEGRKAFNDYLGIKEIEGKRYISIEEYNKVLKQSEENEYMIDELKEKLLEAEESLFEFPSSPIDVAKMLIESSIKFTNVFGKELETNRYDKNELRQIAKHLLVYCDSEVEEE